MPVASDSVPARFSRPGRGKERVAGIHSLTEPFMSSTQSLRPSPAVSRGAADGRLAERVRELEVRLSRERSGNAGHERGLTALDASDNALRRENERLRPGAAA